MKILRRPVPPGRSRRRRLLVAALTPLLALTPALASAQGAWLTLEPLPDPGRSRLAAATAPCPGALGHKDTDTCVYAIGGTTDGGDALRTVQAYNPATNTWISVASLDTGRRDLAAATAPCPGSSGERGGSGEQGGNGGRGNNGEQGNTGGHGNNGGNGGNGGQGNNSGGNGSQGNNNGQGNNGGHGNNGGQGNTGGNGNNNGQGNNSGNGNNGGHGNNDGQDNNGGRASTCVYAYGGTNSSGTTLSSVEAYNPATNTWSSVTSMDTPRADLAGTAAPCPKKATGLKGICVYAIGGTNGAVLDSVEAYSPETNRWVTLEQDLPTARSGLAAATALCPAVVVGRKETCVYAIGGDTGAARRQVEVFLPGAGVWATLPDLPPPARNGLAATGAPCPTQKDVSCVYAVGGATAGGAPLGTTHTYNPAVNVWATLPDLPTPRTQLAATSAPCPHDLRRHCVYAIGGQDRVQNQPRWLTTVEAFDIDK